MNPSLSPLALFSSIGGLIALAAFHGWTSRINHYFFFARTLPRTFVATNAARKITMRYLGMVCTSPRSRV